MEIKYVPSGSFGFIPLDSGGEFCVTSSFVNILPLPSGQGAGVLCSTFSPSNSVISPSNSFVSVSGSPPLNSFSKACCEAHGP